jgi:hypothetical protein
MGLSSTTASWKLGAGWTSDGPGAGYFPFYIGVILCISGAGILYQSLLGKKRNTEIFVDGEQIKRVLVVLIPAASTSARSSSWACTWPRRSTSPAS